MEAWFQEFCPHVDPIKYLEREPQVLAPRRKSSSSAPSIVTAILADSFNPFPIPEEPSALRRVLVELALYARSLERDVSALTKDKQLRGASVSRTSPSSESLDISPFPSSHVVYSAAPEDEFTMVPTGDDYVNSTITRRLDKLTVDSPHDPCFGQSSGVMLVKAAIETKKEYTGDPTPISRPVFPSKRPGYWNLHPWEQVLVEDERRPFTFPDDDLLLTLVTLYFRKVNIFMPLLHRPTFERSLSEHLHLKNHLFGAIVLLVCAVASRYSYDPRVLLEDADSEHSCGWKYFIQVPLMRQTLLNIPSVYELQRYCLAIVYLQGCSIPSISWTLVSIGIRAAQEFGTHRRKIGKLTVESELWKRAFWVLVSMDKLISEALGRPCATNYEDFDLDLPVECDDEYWEHPDPQLAFQQPSGKPSVISYFNVWLKLINIMGFAMRSIYSVKKPKVMLGERGHEWKKHIVGEIDSALNGWLDSIPEHLRWDPKRRNQVFFDQSASLYASYYYVQIEVHRPFIPSRNHQSPALFPSLALCTNAARACIRLLDLHSKRGFLPLPHVQMALFHSAIIILFNIWDSSCTSKFGLATNSNKHLELTDVHKCMNILRTNDTRWQITGRLWDILNELISLRDRRADYSSNSGTLAHIPNENTYTIGSIRTRLAADIPSQSDATDSLFLPNNLQAGDWASLPDYLAQLDDTFRQTNPSESSTHSITVSNAPLSNEAITFLAAFNHSPASLFDTMLR